MNDKNNNSFVYKILFILLVFILFIFCFLNYSFADLVVDLDGIIYTFPDISTVVIPEQYSDRYSYNNNFIITTNTGESGGYTLFILPNSFSSKAYYNSNRLSFSDYMLYCRLSGLVNKVYTLWEYRAYTTSASNLSKIVCSTIDIYNSDNEIVFKKNYDLPPKYTYSITMSTTAETSSSIIAYSNYFDYSDASNYEVYISSDGENWTLMNYETFTDDNDVTLFRFNYEITSNGVYYFKFVDNLTNDNYYLSYNVSNIVSVMDKFDEQTGAIKEQTEAIKEQTEVNKNIFERIGDLISFLNPASENFFVYKLLELLGNLIKDLFVPSDDFLSQWFTEVSDYFEDAFGILYYPVDLVIQVLGRFSGISGQEPVISFGDFTLFGAVLVPSFTYNFNDLLTNDTFKMIHDFYLITIDVILWFGLLVYCKNVCANIFGGKFTDDVIDEIQDPGGTEKSYSKHSRYQENKKRYAQENGKRTGGNNK